MLSLPSENFRRPAALARLLLTMAIGLSLDLFTKVLAVRTLAVVDADGNVISSDSYRLINGWLEFIVTTNHGAVFGMAEGYLILFVAVSIAAILFLLYLFANSGRQWFYQIILGMLLAGVLGNLYDRLRFGHVRDMIRALPRWPNLFPWIFNVADVLLCTGVGLMILYSLFQPEPRSSDHLAETPAKG